jgi:hypothetical protein
MGAFQWEHFGRFYLWESGGNPIARRGGEDQDESSADRPMDAQEPLIWDCEHAIMGLTTLGTRAVQTMYRAFASQKSNWPFIDALN